MSKRTLNFSPNPIICAKLMEITLDDDIVEDIIITGSCPGSSQAMRALTKGMDYKDVVERLQGIDCQRKGTSCADQLAQALILLSRKPVKF